MQIIDLTVNGHKCFKNFGINFNIVDGGSSTILIGENGTGKSTMIEVILLILMSFDSDSIEKQINYEYEIKYFYAGKYINLKQSQHNYNLEVGNDYRFTGRIKNIKNALINNEISIFPGRVISFYSGNNDKTLSYIKKLNDKYRSLCKKSILEYIQHLQNPSEYLRPYFPRRKYNYCDEQLTPIFLCSILGGEDSYEKNYLIESADFKSIDNIDVELDLGSFVIKDPLISDGQITDVFFSIIEFIDNSFLEIFRTSFLNTSRGKAYFSISGIETIGADKIALYNFFEKMQLLFRAKYEVYAFYGRNRVKVSDMSEGQRQLIKILGMLGVCKNEDCLVLMDEPDAHMNPKWKYELKSVIDGALQNAVNTQAIIATHDPLVINGVDQRFIRIFEGVNIDNHFVTKVHEPMENTLGLGIDGLLQSEYYRLKTSYDKETSELYQRRQELYIKLINGEISDDEKDNLRKFTESLGAMPISYNTIDFLYDDFIKEFRNNQYYYKEYLTYEEIQERRAKIKEIISALYEERT